VLFCHGVLGISAVVREGARRASSRVAILGAWRTNYLILRVFYKTE